MLWRKKLADIEGTFDEFTQLTKSGDPNSAEEVLTDLNSATSELESYMARIPKLNASLSTEFNAKFQKFRLVINN